MTSLLEVINTMSGIKTVSVFDLGNGLFELVFTGFAGDTSCRIVDDKVATRWLLFFQSIGIPVIFEA